MWKLIQTVIAIFQRILDCCRRCFRRTNDETELLLDIEAPVLPEDTDNDDLKCKTKVEPRLGENNAEFKRELQTLREDREKASMGKLQEKDAEINRLQKELQTFREDREKLQAEVGASEKDAEINRLQRELQALKEKELEFYQKDNKQHQDIKITAEPLKVTSQPTSQADILLGKAVTFSVQATGTQPLDYQWQWKQFGKEGEQDGWEHLPSKGNTFQVTEVKARDAGYYRCVVSNGAASETSQCVSLTVAPELHDLDYELHDVTNWLPFGLYLGLKMDELKTIEVNYSTLQRCRLEMLEEWQKKVIPTWSAVAQALMGIGMRHLASQLAQKHGVPPPKLPDGDILEPLHITNIPQQKEVTGPKLFEEVEKHRGPLEQDRRRLADAEEQLRHSRKSKSAVNEVVSQVMCQLKELREKAQKIVQEKKILLMELESKQMELRQLSELKEKYAEMEHQLNSMKEESESRLRQIESCNLKISHLSEEVKQKEATVAQLKSELRSYEQAYGTPEQQLKFLELSAQIAELEHRLQEVKEQKQQEELDKETAVREVDAMRKFRKLLHEQIAEAPKITDHPKKLKNAIRGKSANFSVQATGTPPLTHQWQWIPSEKDEDWQPCDAKWSSGATLTIPNVQKSNEGIYRCVVSNHVGNVTSESATLETCPLQLPLQLMWGKCKDMAYGMSEYPHSVVLHTNIYVGGGLADDVDEECTIQVYDNNKAEWSSLPRYRYRWFAMSVVNSQLTLVGGKDVSNWKVTNQLAALDTTSQCWMYPYPPMPTPRHRPAVSTYDIWLLVAGGADRRDLATVELLNISTKQWLSTSSLPMPCSRMTSTVLEDKWYLVTNSRRVFRVSLPDIVSQTVSQSADSKLPGLWRRLPDTPLGYSTGIILRGSLLAVGGYHNGTRTDIYHYHPVSEKWIKVGDLPTPRHYCSCVLLSNGKLLVTGGEEISGRTRRVDIAWTH